MVAFQKGYTDIKKPQKKKDLITEAGLANWDEKCPGMEWGVIPYKRLMGMCRWMGSHFHDWIDYNGVAFSIELLEWGRTFSDFWGETVLHIYG